MSQLAKNGISLAVHNPPRLRATKSCHKSLAIVLACSVNRVLKLRWRPSPTYSPQRPRPNTRDYIFLKWHVCSILSILICLIAYHHHLVCMSVMFGNRMAKPVVLCSTPPQIESLRRFGILPPPNALRFPSFCCKASSAIQCNNMSSSTRIFIKGNVTFFALNPFQISINNGPLPILFESIIW